MVRLSELQKWLKTLPIDALVGVDEGGLTLITHVQSGQEEPFPYLEIGGIPEDDLPDENSYVMEKDDPLVQNRTARLRLTAKQRDAVLRIIGQRMDALSESMTKARDMGATLHLPIVSDELETLAAAREILKEVV